jgi:hypothetical protein
MRHGFGKRRLVLTQNGMLDKSMVILLVLGLEHAHDIAYQVCAALGYAIEEQRRKQTSLRKIRIQLIEIVPFGNDSGHYLFR